jgi:cyclopropane fatty-acyl-phospholipid synthase-like methyltransferase
MAVYLATRGFEMTGVDGSATAIAHASRRAEAQGVHCHFVVADLLDGLGQIEGPFDFAYDWELLHHVFPQQRAAYLDTVHGLLSPGSRYLSVCFSDRDPWLDGGKYRKTSLGTVLYFSSQEELRQVFSPRFRVLELESIEVRGKLEPHVAHWALLERPAG